MKVFDTLVIKFVSIDTDIGEFRVTESGYVERWNYDTMDYSEVSEWDLESDDYFQLRKIAEEKLK